jgi:hypothetical protein
VLLAKRRRETGRLQSRSVSLVYTEGLSMDTTRRVLLIGAITALLLLSLATGLTLTRSDAHSEGSGYKITRGLLDSPESVATMESFLAGLPAECSVDFEIVESANTFVFVYACP